MELQRVKSKKNTYARAYAGQGCCEAFFFSFRPIRSAMTPYAGLAPSLRTPTRTASSAKAHAPPYAGLTRAYARKVLGPALRGAYAQLTRPYARTALGSLFRCPQAKLTPALRGAYARLFFLFPPSPLFGPSSTLVRTSFGPSSTLVRTSFGSHSKTSALPLAHIKNGHGTDDFWEYLGL